MPTREPKLPMLLLFLPTAVVAFSANPYHSPRQSIVGCNLIPKDLNLDEIEDIEITPEEKEFFGRTRQICDERNIGFDCIKNARDLSSPPGSPIKANRLYRMGRLSEASDKDIQFLLDDKNINTIIDLRSPTELKDDEKLQRFEIFGDFTNLVWLERGRNRDGCLIELEAGASPVLKRRLLLSRSNIMEEDDDVEDEDCELCPDDGIPANQLGPAGRKERHFVSLMNEFKYVRGTLSKVRKRDIARTVLKSPGALVSRRVRDSVKSPFLDKINDGAGKDRTGMITAIILSFLGVPDEEIVQDYTLSANVYAEMNDHKAMVGALSQRNLDPKTFLGAPPQVMRDTLEAIREDYGSVEGYLEWIGFGPEMQEKLRKALTED
ncbi:Pfam Y phosphatase3C [Fragilaria crotonensis]|nr:Pfam Y phosphatase3C [Fragilaria crotonensis]